LRPRRRHRARGIGGGYNEGWATILASKTRLPTLALAYFGTDGLPPTLENVPLETVERAIAWLGEQEGGVGYTPSGIIWEGIGDDGAPAWTYRGQAFPYLRVLVTEEQERLFAKAAAEGTPYFNTPSFEHSLQVQRSRIAEATIPAERSQAAFLLIGNPRDGVWPSRGLSQVAIDRPALHAHPRPFQLLSYPEGGHMLVPYPYYPTTMRQFYLPTVGVWEGLGGRLRERPAPRRTPGPGCWSSCRTSCEGSEEAHAPAASARRNWSTEARTSARGSRASSGRVCPSARTRTATWPRK